MSERLYDSLVGAKKRQHDTLYVNEKHYHRLIDEVGKRSIHRGSNVNKIAGLDVITMQDFVLPIVCQKGDVFPLAKDWKNK